MLTLEEVQTLLSEEERALIQSILDRISPSEASQIWPIVMKLAVEADKTPKIGLEQVELSPARLKEAILDSFINGKIPIRIGLTSGDVFAGSVEWVKIGNRNKPNEQVKSLVYAVNLAKTDEEPAAKVFFVADNVEWIMAEIAETSGALTPEELEALGIKP